MQSESLSWLGPGWGKQGTGWVGGKCQLQTVPQGSREGTCVPALSEHLVSFLSVVVILLGKYHHFLLWEDTEAQRGAVT
jgi:hypothetical protein